MSGQRSPRRPRAVDGKSTELTVDRAYRYAFSRGVFHRVHLDASVRARYDCHCLTHFVTGLGNVAPRPKSRITLSAFFREVGPGRSIRVYWDKEIIYSQEQSANAIFYIQSGIVKLTIADKRRRKDAVLAILTKGDVFGEGCLLRTRATRRISTAASIGSSTIARVEKAAFRDRIEREPALAVLVITQLIAQAVQFKMDLADHRINSRSSERRLARILLAFHRLRSTTEHAIPPFSQTTLAGIVGITRPRINRFMNKFRKQGYVRYNGALEIDAERLSAFLRA